MVGQAPPYDFGGRNNGGARATLRFLRQVHQLFEEAIVMCFVSGVCPSLLIFTSSQTMLKAISSGVTAPIEMPIGE